MIRSWKDRCKKCGHRLLVQSALIKWIGRWYWAVCPVCGISGPFERSYSEALAAWNRRAEKGTDHA